jgi:hypothetical protein
LAGASSGVLGSGVKVAPLTLCSGVVLGASLADSPAEADSLAEAEADPDAAAVAVAVAVAVGLAVSCGVAVGLAVTLGVAVGVGVAVGLAVGAGVGVAVGMGVGVAKADGSVRLVMMYVGEKSMLPEESLPLMVHSPTVAAGTDVSSTVRLATLAT